MVKHLELKKWQAVEEALGISRESELWDHFCCPICEYVDTTYKSLGARVGGKRCNEKCPVLWTPTLYAGDITCTHPDSPYFKWERLSAFDFTKREKYLKEKSRLASKVLLLLEQANNNML